MDFNNLKHKLQFMVMVLFAITLYSCDDDDDNKQTTEEEVDWRETGKHENHDFVDLGLPSGTLWATEDLSVDGSYFISWGETTPKTTYNVTTYKYAKGEDNTLTKYCNSTVAGDNSFTDNITELGLEDDACNVNWGGYWSTPSWNELQELYENCNWEMRQTESGNQFVGTSKINGNTIAFSCHGAMQGTELKYAGNGACVWSSTLVTTGDSCMYAWGLSFSSSSIDKKDCKRPIGHCYRAVISGERLPSEAVDLGLPSGVKWASTNIGAAKPEARGYLYAWGETDTKSYYDFTNYIHCQRTPRTFTKYCTVDTMGVVDNKTKLEYTDDAARQLWGGTWRIPTKAEVEELLESCTWETVTINDQPGLRATGPNGNSIFIPLSGTMWQRGMEFVGERGFYWASDLADNNMHGEGLFISMSGSHSLGSGFTRASGRTIRPVTD